MTQSLSDQMLEENRDIFDAMVHHRFVEDIKADRLPLVAFERYLVFEGAFVDTAIAIFAYATAKAETMAQKRWLIGVLDALANQQIAYFEKTFVVRGIDPASYDTSREDVAAFRDGMLAIARNGGFLDTIAAMFAAEWMYWTWSKTASRCTINDPLLKEWVALHAEPAFEAGREREVFIVQQLTNLAALPPTGFEVGCFPIKLARASAAPARVVAFVSHRSEVAG